MKYDMTQSIEEIAKIEGTTAEKIAEELNIKNSDGQYFAWNRKEESAVTLRLNTLKSSIKTIEEKKAVQAGYHWIKDEDGWAVAGNFAGKHEGDTILVARRDGTKQMKMIERFSNIGNAYVD